MSIKQKTKEFFKPSPRKQGSQILNGANLIAIDVGAANGLIPHWHTLDGLATVVSFEPHEQSYIELLSKYAKSDYRDRYKAFPFGLSREGGPVTLYMLNERTGSSILPINFDSPYLIKDDPYVFPINEVTIETKSLEDVFESEKIENPAMIKLDIQGAEIEVLMGLGKSRLNDLMSVELEVGFQSFHKNAPTPFSTIELMRELNFDFFDMTTNRFYTGKNANPNYFLKQLNVSSIYNKVSNKLVETDLLFFKNQNEVLNRNDAALVNKLIVTYCVYNFFADACQLNEKAADKGIFSQLDVQRNFKAIQSWSNIYNWKYPYSFQSLHNKFKSLKSNLSHKPWQTPSKDL